jgi:hypothetical protein
MPVIGTRDRPGAPHLPLKVITNVDARALGGGLAVLIAIGWQAYWPNFGAGGGAALGTVLTVLVGALFGGRPGESITPAEAHQLALDRAADRAVASRAATRDELAAEIRGLGPPA